MEFLPNFKSRVKKNTQVFYCFQLPSLKFDSSYYMRGMHPSNPSLPSTEMRTKHRFCGSNPTFPFPYPKSPQAKFVTLAWSLV